MRAALRIAISGVLVTASLQAQTNLPAGTWRITNAPADLRDEISRSDLIIVSMHAALQRELKRKLAEGGPTFAANSCHINVQGLVQHLGLREGIVAGRTSDRLRNPLNKPRPWAAALVQANAGRNVRDVDGFVVDLGNVVGVLRPIAEQRMCSACHGAQRQIDPAVRAAIARRFPFDRATGFNEGEIRGWFWVEMQKMSSR
jgi:Protein of unknown function (DUF3365)